MIELNKENNLIKDFDSITKDSEGSTDISWLIVQKIREIDSKVKEMETLLNKILEGMEREF